MGLPIRDFVAAQSKKPDGLALAIVFAVLFYSACILLLPLSETARRAGMERFQLTGWPLAVWALFQPTPSMYNFENEWDVTPLPPGEWRQSDGCPERVESYVNHHVYNRIVLPNLRLLFHHCPLPVLVHFRSTYMGTRVETTYRLEGLPGDGGIAVTPVNGQ